MHGTTWHLWWLIGAASLTIVALLAGACSNGARPTLTAEPLVLEPEPTSAPPPVATTEPGASSGVDAGALPQGRDAAQSTPSPGTTAGSPTADIDAAPVVEQLVVEVLDSFPHDTDAFTQGLEVHDGRFIESTGLRFESDLRRVVPETGEVVQIVETPSGFFAEGVTKVDDELIQLTWQDQVALFWDADTFELLRTVDYTGEGWGLCFDGTELVMSDGTPVLIFRDPVTFDEVRRTPVTLEGQPLNNLNEVECVDGSVWANLWRTDLIVRIDPPTGAVTAVVDASALERPPQADVLNGIAWDENTQSFWLTGKWWPTMYRVDFVPAPER